MAVCGDFLVCFVDGLFVMNIANIVCWCCLAFSGFSVSFVLVLLFINGVGVCCVCFLFVK